jgi:hypothetical protein
MSTSLVPVGSSRLPMRVERQVGREIARVRASQALVVVRESAKVEAIADITRSALIETSQVSEIEAILFERSPHAGSRLKCIADAGVAAIADVVLRAGRAV